MTSRPSAPAQRSLSGNNVLQRPSQHRTLSQQFPSSSPTRRNNESFVDLTLEGSDAAPGRYGGAPRIGGSRLKLEITKDSRHSTHTESPKPILDAPPLWKPSVPLRGRPQLHSELPDGLSSGAVQQGPSEALPLRPMPMPIRPGQHSPPNRDDKPRVAPGNTPKKDGRPKPYSLEVPAAAPRYTPNGHADFFPWTGNHPEDQFSETVIRQGFFDKTQMTQNETGTARVSIFPALKHKTGLQTLSSLFTGILAQRRAHGQITSNSSFKPPPRVTVTDTKREVWLKDLANPTISLRRLSRSIPHGVRGKILLDQALSKNIPIERTVWLAKCVGANELRSFRRKGVSGTFAMGGEAKWIRDFTVNVEQFMESIIGSCGEKDFKNRINYAIRLSTHFHAEHLLDREHFMDWLVLSLENSPDAKLPVWLLITQIYWKDLLKYRKYGRRLSAAILGYFTDTVVHEDRDIMGPLLDRLRILLRGLMISNPESFVSPIVWAKHRSVLQSNLGSNDHTLILAFTMIDTRNGRLTAPGTEKQLSLRQQLIQQLDMLFSKPYTNEMSTQYWHLSDNKEMLIRTILEWSTSSHRPGFTKIFVGTRIVRSWSRNGAAVTEAILNFLESTACETGRCRYSVYHLISELARSEHFSTPAYLQWLIARGGLYDSTEVAEDGPLATRLLAELPTHNISEGIISLRSTLLHRASFDVDDEDERTKACMCLIDKALPGMQTNMNSAAETCCAYSVDHFEAHLPKLSRTSKSEIGLWLREKVAHQALKSTVPRIDGWTSSPGKSEISPITPSELSTVRHFLELMGDFSMLADVLRIATSSNDADVLSSIADSLDLHLECFAAVGALKGLFEILLTRLRSVFEDHDSLPRVFLASLASLAGRMPEQKAIAEHLAQELARSDRKTAADACSPVSDHMAGVLQVEEADFTDEIEKVLASGNSMDKATLERLFQRIIGRLEASWGKSTEQQRSCGLLLTRLKTFDALHFDTLMTAWVHRFQQMSIRPSMTEVFAPLISFGCLDLSNTSVNMAPKNGALEVGLENHIVSRNSREALSLAIIPSNIPGLMTTEEAYRFRIRQTHLQKDHPTEILSLIRRAIEHSSSSDTPDGATGILDILESLEARQVVQRLVVVDSESTSQNLVLPLCNSGNHNVLGTIESLIDGLLVPGLEKHNFERVRTEIVLGLANDLTLPFCRLKLASMFSSKRSPDIDRTASTRLEAFQNAIEAAVSGGSTTWASIVPLMDVPIAQHLRSKAQLQFLASFPSIKSAATYDLAKSKDQIVQAKNLLYIIDATAYNGPYMGSSPSALPTEIVGTLQNTWLILSHSQYFVLRQEVVTQWLPLLVRFSAYHASAFEPSKAGNELRVKALLALSALLLELGALDVSLETINGLIEQTFDLALVLVDSLPDDLRHYCIRSLKDSISNPRLRYLFSYAGNPSDWLILSQKDKAGLSSTLGVAEARTMDREKLVPFPLRRWEMLGVDPESGPKSYLNDTSLSLTLFGARKS